MPSAPNDAEALALVHQGWDHLKLQRPLAAWACWQRALRVKAGDDAAQQALDLLATARDLPDAARRPERFRTPADPSRRARWDARFRGDDLADLDRAAAAFADLAADDPADADAWYNRGLCLAWLGRNVEAIDALGRVLGLFAEPDPDAAVDAWTLAEVLRQGGGAEPLADDLNHSLTVAWPADRGDPVAWLGSFAALRPLPAPLDPATGRPAFPDTRSLEWLDRPMPAPSADLTADDLPRLRASVIATPGTLRFSSPSAEALQRAEAALAEALGDAAAGLAVERRSTPRPIALMDADVWQFRLPDGLDPADGQRLRREAVERYYEQEWIAVPRHGLAPPGRSGALSPAEAERGRADLPPAGAAEARAALAAVVRLREQLARRPHVAGLYGGYPFDRLRRRLALAPLDAEAIDPSDPSCMSRAELEALDPAAIDPALLPDAYRAARPVCDAATTARLAAALADRGANAGPALLLDAADDLVDAGDPARARTLREKAKR